MSNRSLFPHLWSVIIHTHSIKSSVWVLVFLSLLPAAHGRPKREADVRTAFVINSTQVDPGTAEAAARPLFDKIVKKIDLTYSITSEINYSGLLEKMKSGEINVAFGSALQYIKLSEHLKLVPLSVTKPFGHRHFTLLLLTRRNAGITRVAQLKGKSISYSTDDINQVYLSVLLHGIGAGDPEAFFDKVSKKENRKSPVMELLMGDADSCLVSNDQYRAMSVLNPQVKKKLMTLNESKAFAQNTMFARADTPKPLISKIEKTSYNLHKDPAGRQILLIFRIKGLARPSRSDFNSVRELWRQYTQLSKKKKK